jgi:hypothetical protein
LGEGSTASPRALMSGPELAELAAIAAERLGAVRDALGSPG